MNNTLKVGDIMTRDVLVVSPDDSLEKVSELFEKYRHDGFPVVDRDRNLVGLITEYDMVAQSSGMHLPTVINLMRSIGVEQKDRERMDEHFSKLKLVKAKEIMNGEPMTVRESTEIGEVARLFSEHHKVNPLCVLDGNGKFAGVLSHHDVILFFNKKLVNAFIKTKLPPAQLSRSSRDSGKTLRAAVESTYKGVLLVSSFRPMIWKVVALAAFLAGVVTTTVFVFDIVISPR